MKEFTHREERKERGEEGESSSEDHSADADVFHLRILRPLGFQRLRLALWHLHQR